MAPKPKPEHGNKKFNARKRQEYLDCLRGGFLKFGAARYVGVEYKAIQRHRKVDPEFVEAEALALAEAREEIEEVVFGLAKEGDLAAIKMWMTAHDRSTYGDKQTVEIDATPNAVELSKNEALGKLADLEKTLAERRAALIDSGDIIDAESEEVPVRGSLGT